MAILDQLVSYSLSADGTREGLVLNWLMRWGRRGDKTLWQPAPPQTAAETATVTVPKTLWNDLFEHGFPQRMWPDDVASAVVNDWAGRLAWKRTYGKLEDGGRDN